MNHDQNQPDLHIDPELEARVVAWVAGEASPFEIAEMERIVAAQPELAVFKRRIEAVHGLVREAARPDASPLLMSPERRAKLLATIGAAPEAQPLEQRLATYRTVPRRSLWREPQFFFVMAGVAAVGLIALITVPGFRTLEFSSRRPATATAVMQFEKPESVVNTQGVVDHALRSDGPGRPAGVSYAPMPEPSVPRRAVPEIVALGQNQLFEGRQAAEEAATKLKSVTVNMPRVPPPPASSPAPAPENRTLGYSSFGGSGRGGRGGGGGGLAAGVADYKNPPAANQTLDFDQRAPGTLNQIAQARGTVVLGGRDTYTGVTTLSGSAAPVTLGTGAMIGGMGGAASGGKSNFNEAERGRLIGTDESIVKMDAFTVEASREGYAASNSLAGTRINANQLALNPAVLPPPPPISLQASDSGALRLEAFEVATASKTRGGFSAGFGSGVKKEAASAGNAATSPLLSRGAPDIIPPTDVTVSDTFGYIQSSTIAGTRLNSELKDLAGSMVVLSKESLVDKIGALDAEKQKAAVVQEPRAESDDLKRPARPAPVEPPSTEETSTAKEPVSTFSLHVSDVSFRLAQGALARGQMPDAAQIRPEEIYNAFDYGDPSPATAEKVGIRIEQSAHPFLQQRNLVRIAVKVPATGRGATQPLRLTVLLDTSGSMEREDRVATVRRAMEVLVSLLGPQDRVTLIGFARQPRLLAVDVPGHRAKSLLDLIARTPAEGGTNLEEALKLGGEMAQRNRASGEQNRVVVLTDGAANLGDADPGRLATMVADLRQKGIAFDACGVGLNGLDDAMLEPLTRKGDGRYYVLDTPESADAGFARQLAGAFRPAAENVKLQVRFNPARVASYRLIGFEKHRLNTEDFRNDKVDAAELAAEEAAVAVYQVEPLPQGEGELGEVFVRFRDATGGAMVERSWTMSYDARAAAFDRATPSMQLAGAAALVAEKLRASPLAGQFKLADFAGTVHGLRGSYASQPRVQEFVTMFDLLRRVSGE